MTPHIASKVVSTLIRYLFAPKMAIHLSSFITLCLGSIGMYRVLSEPRYKGTVLLKNYRKVTITWSFSYDSMIKKIEGHKLILLCPNPCYNEMGHE